MSCSVLLAGNDDVGAMHRIRIAVRENRLSNPGLVTPASYLPYVRDRSAWIAWAIDGAMLGFAVLDGADANVWALFVAPGREGGGVGQALHDALLADARLRGLARLWLTTAPGTRAEAFYRRAGWHAVGITCSGELRFERGNAG